MIRIGVPFSVLVILIALVLSCGDEEKETKTFDLSREVARMDGEVFTLADLNEVLRGMGWEEATRLNRVKDTAQYNFKAVEEMLIADIIEERAKDFSIDTIAAAQRRLREHVRRIALANMWNDIVANAPEVTPEDVDTFYQNNKRMFFTPVGAEIAQILVSTNPADYLEEGESHSELSEDSVEILAMDRMQEVVDALDGGKDFGELAKEYSHDRQSGAQGGYIGWVEKGQTPPTFDSVVFSLEPGEISPAFKTRYGYHVVKMLSFRDSSYMELEGELYDYIKQGLEGRIRTAHADAFLDSLRKRADIVYNEPLLKKELDSFEPYDWVAIIDGVDTVYAFAFIDAARNHQMVNRLPGLDADAKKDAMRRTLNHHILAAEARKRGYFETEDVVEAAESFESQLKEQHYRWSHEPKEYSPTEEELKAYYEAHKDEYYNEQPLKVKHILFEDSLKAEEVRRKIEDGADFDEMAMKYYPGDEEIRESLYDLGYISRDEMPIKFFNAAWILDVGSVSRPIRTEYGYHLIKLEDRKPMREFSGVRNEIHAKIVTAHNDSARQAYLDDLFAGKTVDVDSTLVREFVFQEVEESPPDTTIQSDSLEMADPDSMIVVDSVPATL